MNIFKEMALSVYSYKSYKEFLKNKKSKVFGFGVLLMLIYFLITTVIPFLIPSGSGLKATIENDVPDFELKDGVLWVDDIIEVEESGTYVYIDTDPYYFFYDADEIAPYIYEYSTAILIDSEKMIVKSNGQIQGVYFSKLDFDFSKEALLDLVPFMYAIAAVVMVLIFIWETALFFFGVLFVALLGMIVASCMKHQLTFGQLYLLGVYSRTLPLLIKAVISFLPFKIPFFFIINFGISLLIIGCAIQKMKEQNLQQPLQFTSGSSENGETGSISNSDDLKWMQ